MAENVLLLHEARMELRDIAMFHKQAVGPVSARKITNRILDALDKLAVFPEMGATVPVEMAADAGFRYLIAGEYLCFYRIDGDTVFVHHIVHGSTDYIKRLFV